MSVVHRVGAGMRTWCGIVTDKARLTDDLSAVTCRRCIRDGPVPEPTRVRTQFVYPSSATYCHVCGLSFAHWVGCTNADG